MRDYENEELSDDNDGEEWKGDCYRRKDSTAGINRAVEPLQKRLGAAIRAAITAKGLEIETGIAGKGSINTNGIDAREVIYVEMSKWTDEELAIFHKFSHLKMAELTIASEMGPLAMLVGIPPDEVHRALGTTAKSYTSCKRAEQEREGKTPDMKELLMEEFEFVARVMDTGDPNFAEFLYSADLVVIRVFDNDSIRGSAVMSARAQKLGLRPNDGKELSELNYAVLLEAGLTDLVPEGRGAKYFRQGCDPTIEPKIISLSDGLPTIATVEDLLNSINTDAAAKGINFVPSPSRRRLPPETN